MTGSLSRVLKERLGFYSSGSNDLLTFTCPKGKALGFLRQVLPTCSLLLVLKERLGFYSSGSNDLLTFTCPKGKALGFLRQVLPTCSLLLVLKERLWVFFVRFYRPAHFYLS